jgi:hypothetical protein
VVKLRDFEMLFTVHRIIKGKFRYGQSIVYRSEIHGYNTRNWHNIQLPLFRMGMGRSSFKYEAFERFNGLYLYQFERRMITPFLRNLLRKNSLTNSLVLPRLKLICMTSMGD